MESLLLLLLLTVTQKDADLKASMEKFLKFYRENRDMITAIFSMPGMPPSSATPEGERRSQDIPKQDAKPSAANEGAAQSAPPDVRILEEYLRRASF